jgi:hypothetical protein
MSTHKLDPGITEKWENGELGRSEEHVLVFPDSESEKLDADLAMKLISIRLPIPLIESLKQIAAQRGVTYQPLVRELLMQFAATESGRTRAAG